MTYFIDSSDGGCYRDADQHDPLPSYIGPFATRDDAEMFMIQAAPLWGSYQIGKLTDPPAAGGVSPTAPDEREALATAVLDGLLASTTVPFTRESAAVMWVVESVERAGFRRSREATTEPQPITDKAIEVAAKILWIAHQDDPEWGARVVDDVFSPADDWPDDALHFGNVARALLEAVEASRSPKDNGGRS
ncbi:hypothetical protein [Microbacterium lacus]|uniref:hypothetical protein n=1 Tax=Microbacterium lacus TaxID=415217 RepID=UPI000C2C780E|nr:hypothetical protein [Microbacterium lacus]